MFVVFYFASTTFASALSSPRPVSSAIAASSPEQRHLGNTRPELPPLHPLEIEPRPRQLGSATGSVSTAGSAAAGSGNWIAASLSSIFVIAFGPMPGNPSTLFASIFIDIINPPTVSIPASTRMLKTCSFNSSLSKRHAKGSSRDFGTGTSLFLFFRPRRIFLDLNCAAFHAIYKLREYR